MMTSAYKCDKCKSLITHGFEFGHVASISNNQIIPIINVRTPGRNDVARICDMCHYCHNCAFEVLFPEKIEKRERGGPGDW
jgi:hypothetical protein